MRRFPADAALAVVLTFLGVQGTFAAARGALPHRPLDALGVALVVGVGAVISVRRLWPEAALIASAVMTTTYLLLNYACGPVFFLFMVSSYSVARYRPPRRSLPVAGAAVVDDQDLVRLGSRTLIDNEDGMTCVGEAVDGLAAVEKAKSAKPGVILMDIRMPGVDGLEATRRITGDPALSATRVIVLTTFEHDQYVFDALRYGASGFLLKDTKPAELLRAIRVVADGAALLSPTVTRRLVHEFVSRSPRAPT